MGPPAPFATHTSAGVGVVVRSRDGLVLVAERRGDAVLTRAVPGGRLDPGESFEVCAVRELAEETGLVLEPTSVRTFACVLVEGTPDAWIVAGVSGTIDAPAARISPEEREPDKVGGFAWIDPAQPPEDLYPATRALLARYVVGP